jgi:hypothetical protein
VHDRLPVNYYLHLREQGKGHEDAVTHTVQRYGVLRDELVEALVESKNHHQALLDLLADVS